MTLPSVGDTCRHGSCDFGTLPARGQHQEGWTWVKMSQKGPFCTGRVISSLQELWVSQRLQRKDPCLRYTHPSTLPVGPLEPHLLQRPQQDAKCSPVPTTDPEQKPAQKSEKHPREAAGNRTEPAFSTTLTQRPPRYTACFHSTYFINCGKFSNLEFSTQLTRE